MNDLKIFGENVRKYRNIKRMTQEQLAESISTSSVQIGRIECGKNACTIQMVLKLCKALKVTPNDLFANIDNLPTNDDNAVFINKFIKSHDVHSEETKKLLRHIVDYFELKQNASDKA